MRENIKFELRSWSYFVIHDACGKPKWAPFQRPRGGVEQDGGSRTFGGRFQFC